MIHQRKVRVQDHRSATHEIITENVDGVEEMLKDMGINVDDTVSKPNVEGVYAFHKTWDAAMSVLSLAVDHAVLKIKWDELKKERPERVPDIPDSPDKVLFHLAGAAANASALSRGMSRAHPITFDPEQYAALPDWETAEEALEYATHVKLPFETCWFDLELPLRRATRKIGSTGSILHLNGALVSIQDTILAITPIVFVSTETSIDKPINFSKVQSDARYWPIGTVQIALQDTSLPEDWQHPFKEYEKEVIGAPFNIVTADWEWFTKQTEIAEPLNLEDESQRFEFDLNAHWDHEPSRYRLINIPFADPGRDDKMVMHHFAITAHAVCEVLKILYFLDTPGIVELAEAKMSRQVRRQAERSGAKIAQTIYVRQNTKRYERKDSDSERMEFSHRFEVRGHWKYYPENTRAGRARPDLLRYVPGRGLCRKIWCPPFVKGPADAPLVIKTRRVCEDTTQADA